MKKPVANYIKGRLKSFTHAFHGVHTLLREERNAQIHLALCIIVLLMAYWLDISAMEWIVVYTVIGLVFVTEAINTAIEKLADFACNKEIHPSIKKIKDLSAAAVLFATIVALIVGLIIFIPKLLDILNRI